MRSDLEPDAKDRRANLAGQDPTGGPAEDLKATREGGAIPSYVAGDNRSAPRTFRTVAVGLGVVVLLGFGMAMLVVLRGSDSTSDMASPGATSHPDSATPDELKAATEQLEQRIESGWVPFGPLPGAAGVEVPQSMWMRVEEGAIAPPELDNEVRRIPVYDRPSGDVIGYDYLSLGYIPLDMVEAGFDASSARIEKYGCEVELDEMCRKAHKRELIEQGRAEAREGLSGLNDGE